MALQSKRNMSIHKVLNKLKTYFIVTIIFNFFSSTQCIIIYSHYLYKLRSIQNYSKTKTKLLYLHSLTCFLCKK